ncbi:hypothetical protein D3C76_647390 [compost metagenome]
MAQHRGRYRGLRGKPVQTAGPRHFHRNAELGQFLIQRFVAGDEDALFLLRSAAMAFPPIVPAMVGTDEYQPVFLWEHATPLVYLVQ